MDTAYTIGSQVLSTGFEYQANKDDPLGHALFWTKAGTTATAAGLGYLGVGVPAALTFANVWNPIGWYGLYRCARAFAG